MKNSVMLPLSLGGFLGLFVILDPFFRPFLASAGFGQIPRIPYMFALACAFVFVLFSLFFTNVEKIWLNRFSIFIILYIVSYQAVALVNFGAIDINDMILFALSALLLVEHFMNREKKVETSPLFFPVLFILFSLVLSCVNGGEDSFARLLTTVFKYLLVFFILLNLLVTRRDIHFFMKGFLFVTAISAVIAIIQVSLYFFTGLIIVGNVDHITLSLMFQDTPLGKLIRAPAFLGAPQKLASTLNVTLAVSLYYLFSKNIVSSRKRLLLLVPIFFMIIAMVLTFTRGTWLGLLGAVLCIPYIRNFSRSIQYTAVYAVMALVLYFLGVWDYLGNLFHKEMLTGDVGYRIELLKSGINGFISEHPLIGIGIDQGYKYHPNPFSWTVHNSLVQAAVETGILGFLSYCLLLGLLAFRLISLILSLKEEKEKTLPKALLTGFISLFIYMQTDPSFHDSLNWIYFALIEGVVLSYKRQKLAEWYPAGDVLKPA